MLAQPVIVLSVSSLANDVRIVTHELTHVIAFNVIPDQPAWLAEGLAGYFETVRFDEDSGKIQVGRPLDFRIRQIRTAGLASVAQLFACNKPACEDDRFYASTWALVSYLINEHPAELMRYLERLAATPNGNQSTLWAEMFPSLTPAALDGAVVEWAAHGKTKISEYTASFTHAPTTQRPLTDADVLSARGLLRYLFASTVVPAEITEALAVDASAVLPNLIDAAVARAVNTERAQRVAAAHPEDWRAWWLVALATSGSPGARDAMVKMCALLEKNPAALPPQACAPETLDPTKDPRRPVFQAAVPQINACFAVAKGPPSSKRSLEIDIAASGAVTGARASVGSPEADACIVKVLRALTFPPGYPGVFRSGSTASP